MRNRAGRVTGRGRWKARRASKRAGIPIQEEARDVNGGHAVLGGETVI